MDETAEGGHEYVIDCPRCGHCCSEREWVGLTDEEINDWFFQRLKQAGAGWALDDVVRAIEAKLKEKNT